MAQDPAMLGRGGLGWRTGLHGGALGDGPTKREGDGRSPAGVFALGPAFGYAPRPPTADGLPYVAVSSTTQGVEDPRSAYYNQIVDRATVLEPDWTSAEFMRRDDDLYRWGVFVQHNSNPVTHEPPLGSCVFLHAWRGPGHQTAGCTAIPLPRISRLVAWLRADAHPVLVQLPRAEFDRLRSQWALPEVPSPAR